MSIQKNLTPMSLTEGFTLIELLAVVGIIGVLAAVILASLGSARDKGADAAIRSNLANARSQAEVFYNTNTASPNSYIGLCNQAVTVGGAKTLFDSMNAAALAYGLNVYATNATGALGSATCNENGTTWSAEVPLKAGGVWCVDSAGKSKAEAASFGAGTVCA